MLEISQFVDICPQQNSANKYTQQSQHIDTKSQTVVHQARK